MEPGEHLLQAAAREVHEETGYAVVLGAALGSATHERPGGKTTVHWWSAQLKLADRQVAAEAEQADVDGAEVDAVRWVPPQEALRLLTYRSDRAALRRFSKRPRPAAVVLLVRHASAGSQADWSGPDELRPLDAAGSGQATRLATVLGVFDPRSFTSANLVRCVDTLRPLADRVGVAVIRSDDLSDATWLRRPSRITQTVRGVASATEARPAGPGLGSVVLCSQGGAIPAVLHSLATPSANRSASGLPSSLLPASALTRAGLPRARKGSVWVLGFQKSRLVSADYFPDLAPS